jgi:hypothetical protein
MLVNRQYKEEFCKSSDLVPIARCCLLPGGRTELHSDCADRSSIRKKSPVKPSQSPALWSQGNFPLCCQQARRPDISGLQVPAAPHGTLALRHLWRQSKHVWNISKPTVATGCELKSVGSAFWMFGVCDSSWFFWVWLPCAPSYFKRCPFDSWCVI